MKADKIKIIGVIFSASILVLFGILIILSSIHTTRFAVVGSNTYESVNKVTIYCEDGHRVLNHYDDNYNFSEDNCHSDTYECFIDLSSSSLYEDPALSIMTSHIAFDVYQNGVLIHQYANLRNDYLGGIRTVVVKLSSNYQESDIKIVCHISKIDIENSIRNLYVGSWLSLILSQCALDLLSFAVGISILLLSVIWLGISFLFSTREGKLSLVSFASVLFSLGLWIVTQSKSKCLFTTNVAWPLDLSYFAIFILPPSICYYINSNYKGIIKSYYSYFYAASIAFLCFGLINYALFIFFNISYETFALTFAGIFIIVFIITLLIAILVSKEKAPTLVIGLIAILVGVSLEEVLHILNIVLENANVIYLSMYVAVISLLFHSIGECSKNSLAITSSRRHIVDKVYRDALTNLENRRALDLRLDNIGLFTDKSYAISLLDIDGFKKYNDDYGHAKGDEILVSFSNKLLSYCDNNQGYCYRVGGDEFVAILPFEEGQSIYQIEQSLKNATSPISVSVGVSIFLNGFTKNIKDSLKSAENRMYLNKKKTKD